MHIEVLVEEPSAQTALQNLLPKMLGNRSFRIISFNGKADLLFKLPKRLCGYANLLRTGWEGRIVVLIDEDREDCFALKARLEKIARDAGLATKTSPEPGGRFTVLNRIAVEEIEAWFFGDIAAMRTAYPRLPPTLGQRRSLRNPDAITGGTWEALEKVLQEAGYFPSGLAKIKVAREISIHMDPARNRSPSFRAFWQGISSL